MAILTIKRDINRTDSALSYVPEADVWILETSESVRLKAGIYDVMETDDHWRYRLKSRLKPLGKTAHDGLQQSNFATQSKGGLIVGKRSTVTDWHISVWQTEVGHSTLCDYIRDNNITQINLVG